jgi:hypothetical protein
MATEPKERCAVCGDETAVGSVRFSDRVELAGPDGTTVRACGECAARVRAGKGGGRLIASDFGVFSGNAAVSGANLLTDGGS